METYKLMDGNQATANIAYHFSEICPIYPITPSSNMAESVDEWSKTGKLNLFDMPVKVEQLQSEAGVAGALHGALAAGALANSFTSSQGLLLMIPNMFKMAGELLPNVLHVSARAISSHALSIFAEHSDVMACRTTGYSMLASSSVQEAQDMALVAHISALKSSVPFLHFFDGFRTSHEIQKIKTYTKEQLNKITPFDKIEDFRKRGLNPSHPHQQGVAQNPDIFFQNKEAQNIVYNQVYDIVKNTMQEVSLLSGKHYSPFEYIGSHNAKYVIVSMASSTETIEEFLSESNNSDLGLVKVRLYRPFNSKALVDALPKNVKLITVLDRTKENGANFEPLALDVISALNDQNKNIKVLAGRYGLGSKDFTPTCVSSVYENMISGLEKNHFTVGIVDDVTHTSLDFPKDYKQTETTFSMKFFGLGGDGTVSANQNTIKIIGENTNKSVQGYFEYDSKKSGSLTISHLRISDKPIKSAYLVYEANFIAIHNYNFVARYDILHTLKQNGTVLLNTALKPEELNKKLPKFFKQDLINKNATLFIINAQEIAKELDLNNKINIIMQSAFFKCSNIIDFDTAKSYMKQAIIETYANKGDKALSANQKAIELGHQYLQQVEINTLDLENHIIMKDKNENKQTNEYYEKFVKPINQLQGNKLEVSAFSPDGRVPTGTTQFEKRGISSRMPQWIAQNCIQCGMCTVVCPHAAIRSVIVKDTDLENKPDGFVTIGAFGVPSGQYKIQVSPMDCTGCGVCADVCPAISKALVMKDMSELLDQEKINYEYYLKLTNLQTAFNKNTVKGLQFEKPYFEFNYACAGCGETPYIKIATQLFGENMIIANATGCSSIYSGSSPACPYTKNQEGFGPSWASSLLEDNAEFGMGMSFAVQTQKAKLYSLIEKIMPKLSQDNNLKEFANRFLQDENSLSNQDAKEFIKLLNTLPNTSLKEEILKLKDFIAKKSVWIIGGDGWAYDIGYGGLDHLLASNQDVNILVLDNEGYSNTGGQSSKSTPRGSFAKFAYGGKKTKKKDLAALALMTNNCYVASVGLGANMQQTLNAFKEAEAFKGPSIIIAYSPCTAHGYDLAKSQTQIKKAVRSGYWNLFRFNPLTKTLNIDNQPPVLNFEEFLMSESRYSSMYKTNTEQAKRLFELAEQDATERYNNLLALKNKLEEKSNKESI
jgi:pyruvate-ferredoxin/flavodoxin oxidoreductase